MLALVGSGEYLPDMDMVDRILLELLGENPAVVCLPTAAGTEGAERIAYWSKLGVNHFKNLGARVEAVPVITRQDAQDVALAAQVRAANFVYLSGGRPDYLLAVLEDSLVWHSIQSVLEHGGILAGCSAGAMIFGEKIPGFPAWRRAFNLLEGAAIIPHFDEIPPWIIPMLRLWIGRRRRLVGIPGYTALVVDGNACKILGTGSVTLWDSYEKRSYSHGESLKW